MLRTMISAGGARGAGRLPMIVRSGFQRPGLTTSIPLRSLGQRSFNEFSTKTKPSTNFTFTSHAGPFRSNPQTILQRLRSLRFFHNSRPRLNGKPNPTPNAADAEPQTLGARMRRLSREYGWAALGVYLMLTALDLPLCYLLVLHLGTDRIGEWEHIVVSNVARIIPENVKQFWHDWRTAMKTREKEISGSTEISDHAEMAGWGVEEATEKSKRDASLATQLALAYAIHKTFIFVRVPLTAAVTPKVVKVLRGWGWDIGKRTTKEAKALRRASNELTKPKGK